MPDEARIDADDLMAHLIDEEGAEEFISDLDLFIGERRENGILIEGVRIHPASSPGEADRDEVWVGIKGRTEFDGRDLVYGWYPQFDALAVAPAESDET